MKDAHFSERARSREIWLDGLARLPRVHQQAGKDPILLIDLRMKLSTVSCATDPFDDFSLTGRACTTLQRGSTAKSRARSESEAPGISSIICIWQAGIHILQCVDEYERDESRRCSGQRL